MKIVVKRLDTVQQLLKAYTKEKTTITVPSNTPVLHFANDVDNKNSNFFETVDKFLELFEVVMYEHKLDIDEHWEACIFTSVQHPTEKWTWYKNMLTGHHYRWTDVKEMLRRKFDGNQAQEYYLQKLNNMLESKHQNPVNSAYTFRDTMKSAGVVDNKAYELTLLNTLQHDYGSLVSQIKEAYTLACTQNVGDLDVDYISTAAPILHGVNNSRNKEPIEDNNKRTEKYGNRYISCLVILGFYWRL